MRFISKRCFYFCVLTMLVAGFVQLGPERASAAKTCAEAKVAMNAGNALIKAARSGSKTQFNRALSSFSNVNTIARFSLGKHRKKVPASRMGEYTRLIRNYLSQTFVDYRAQLRAKSIELVDCRGKVVRTNMHFLGARGKEAVHWKVSGNRVVDIRLQNLWLAQQLRGWIDDEMRKNGGNVNKLFAQIKKWTVS